jgi:hypothetical protein
LSGDQPSCNDGTLTVTVVCTEPLSVEEILALGVVGAPAPTPVLNVVAEVLATPELIAAARTEIVTALAGYVPSSSPAAVILAPREIKSEIGFPVPLEDSTAVCASGTPERIEFETSFKGAISSSLGGGGVFDAADIGITACTAGSITVGFQVVVPQEVTQVCTWTSTGCVCMPAFTLCCVHV